MTCKTIRFPPLLICLCVALAAVSSLVWVQAAGAQQISRAEGGIFVAAAEWGLNTLHERPEGMELILSAEFRPGVTARPPALEQVDWRIPERKLRLDGASRAEAAERLGKVPCVGLEDTCPVSTPTVVFRFTVPTVVGREATIQMDVVHFFQPDQVKARGAGYRLHLVRARSGEWSVVDWKLRALI